MMKLFCTLSIILCSFQLRAATLDVEISGISKEGILHLAIYSSKEVFESDRGDRPGPQPGIVAGSIINVGTEFYKETFEIPAGTYVIGYYIDANENEKLDTNFIGIPKEQFGFSNNARGTFGPPSFESASFTLDSYHKLLMEL
ncbi:MAG: DUF2141 domain-containing protein [Gammaproteobacteria bacterium]|jgi:uncharacterized protein (DUF2141 family)